MIMIEIMPSEIEQFLLNAMLINGTLLQLPN